MKKFTKVSLIIAAIFAGIGLICLVASMVLGVTWGSFCDMVNAGRFQFNLGDNWFYSRDLSESTSTIEEEVHGLDIDFGAGELEIVYADTESIEVCQKGVKGFSYTIDEGMLHIDSGIRTWRNDGKVTLRIPRGMAFDEVTLEVGAGSARVEALAAKKMDIDVGAGKATLTGLDIEQLDANVGAGKIYMELVDNERNYSYDVECGVGSVKVGNTTIGGLGSSKKLTNPGATKFMDLECGVGEIEIRFQEREEEKGGNL